MLAAQRACCVSASWPAPCGCSCS